MGRKGNRHDNECRDFYRDAGYVAECSVSKRYGRTDWFNLFDFMAWRDDGVHFVQVKTGQTGGVIGEINEWAADNAPDTEYITFIVAVRYKGEGWRFVECQPWDDSYTSVVDERGNGRNIGEELVEYLSVG